MFPYPIKEGTFKSDVIAEPFGLQPFMSEYLLPLSQKLLVEARLFDEFAGVLEIFNRQTHLVFEITEAETRKLI